jgi:valyl-tRNA synthetase
MTISTKYNPVVVEDKWYRHWLDKGFFESTPNPEKEPYTIVIPPPNVTGVLHMGHMLNNTIQDVLIRRARMMGKEALWVPGTDHASIATEAKVVAMLKEKGINKRDISREEFLKYSWEWKDKYGGIILEQLKKLGASCDWTRTKFTMDPELSASVIRVFVDLFKKGHIYRGYRMVNWDPDGKTALADDEVIHKEVSSKLFYVKYRIEGEEDFVTIATTRPETILGDTGICIHPDDERYKHLLGKKALVPLINRPIPIFGDDYVDPEFGTGCLKVTPAHDMNDYELGQKHNLETIDIFHQDGTLNEAARLYLGEDRFEVRKKIAFDLEEEGHMVKVEEYMNNVGYSERTHAVVEPRLSLQWYVKMEDLTKPALKNVLNDTVQLVPPKFKNMYRHWMENVRDWCISRQLWWGQRIPAYYLADEDVFNPNAQVFVGENIEEALEDAKAKTGNSNLTEKDLKQDEDVLDTWFSSGLWPITVFNGIMDPDNEEINYYYPTNDLITAPEILFFWVARMVMYGYEYRGNKPFNNVYLTGIVRDGQGRKMSKSLGNSPDPLKLIGEYGADGVRTGMLFSSPAGNDLLFDIKLCEQGRNFSNKVWNAFRLVKGWEVDDTIPTPEGNQVSIDWFRSRFNQTLAEANDQFSKFRISDALKVCYSFTWNDFCSWYLEMIKPEYQKPIDRATYEATITFFEDIMRLLHPFMPFITEEIWHEIRERDKDDCVIVAEWPEVKDVDDNIIDNAIRAFELISQVRNIRNSKNIPNKQPLSLEIKGKIETYNTFMPTILKLANLESFEEIQKKNNSGMGFVIRDDEFIIPISEGVDMEKERENLQKELEYTQGFKISVSKKLENERFVNNAPEQVVEAERKKLADAEARIQAIEKALAAL